MASVQDALILAAIYSGGGIACLLLTWRWRRAMGVTLEADRRATALLKGWLSPSQSTEFERKGSFEVRGCASGRRYRICHGRQGNVLELDDGGNRVAALCFLPEGRLATADVMLSQKIMLETDELNVLRIANRLY